MSHSPDKPGSSADTSGERVAHHITEFGDVENLVHVEAEPSHAESEGIVPNGVKTPFDMKARLFRLRKKLFRPRRLQQHFIGDTLYRTAANRNIAKDELFLDLIIVANSK